MKDFLLTSALITGGARSGKSEWAETLALKYAQDPVNDSVNAPMNDQMNIRAKKPIYIATCEIFDDEMAERVLLHQKRRDGLWEEKYAPLNLAEMLKQTDGHGQIRVVDCLTYWVNNLLYHELEGGKLEGGKLEAGKLEAGKLEAGKLEAEQAIDALIQAIKEQKDPVIFVTNEVGMGIVPETKLARTFRDLAGWVNQKIAAEVEQVYLIISGQIVKVKP